MVFILCTTEAHKVLPTIISRCQTFNFRALSVDAIVGQLHKISSAESIAIASDAMRDLARTCDGGLRDALQLLSQLSRLNSEITLIPIHYEGILNYRVKVEEIQYGEQTSGTNPANG